MAKIAHHRGVTLAALMLVLGSGARAGSPPPPPFEQAYRAWEIVTDLARRNGDPGISGECGKTFQAAVVPALRRQTRQEQDRAAAACVAAARAACANGQLKTTPETARNCQAFR
ncbi:hypothetical protein JI739_22375 [Ramlibacter sp. AW1]|uniref:Uncharacterized protein n=1 Tax=Ramlibacter aurantiacus TaxID=2801330 RepID=A0A937D8I8_9BURK|nr:hypothetical protein [Ramlibacter aurantiacus]MBL0423098.1 hypothetical protein [Ramlibacter aurantiacus]